MEEEFIVWRVHVWNDPLLINMYLLISVASTRSRCLPQSVAIVCQALFVGYLTVKWVLADHMHLANGSAVHHIYLVVRKAQGSTIWQIYLAQDSTVCHTMFSWRKTSLSVLFTWQKTPLQYLRQDSTNCYLSCTSFHWLHYYLPCVPGTITHYLPFFLAQDSIISALFT